jgi:predicted transcriptional regulator
MAQTTALENVERVQEYLLDETQSQAHKISPQVLVTDSQVGELDLLKVVGDEYARAILSSIIDEPKSAIEIAREKKIPISSIYRKIHWLENARLIKVKGFVITGDGKKYHRYQSRIKTIHVSLMRNAVQVEFTNNDGKRYSMSREGQEITIE